MKAGFYNSGQNGQLKGYDAYVIRYEHNWILADTAIYHFTLTPIHPLFFIHPDGRWMQPNKMFETDQGSVPALVQLFIPKDRFIGFYFHDSGYASKGLWVSHDKGVTWKFEPFTRKQLDDLLHDMVLLDPEPAGECQANSIWTGVRIGGWASYGKGDLRKRTSIKN
jgi:hypothetical protein